MYSNQDQGTSECKEVKEAKNILFDLIKRMETLTQRTKALKEIKPEKLLPQVINLYRTVLNDLLTIDAKLTRCYEALRDAG